MKVSRLGSDKSVSRIRKKKPSPGNGTEFADQLKVAAGMAEASGGIEPPMDADTADYPTPSGTGGDFGSVMQDHLRAGYQAGTYSSKAAVFQATETAYT